MIVCDSRPCHYAPKFAHLQRFEQALFPCFASLNIQPDGLRLGSSVADRHDLMVARGPTSGTPGLTSAWAKRATPTPLLLACAGLLGAV
jgi:hypothetical protein